MKLGLMAYPGYRISDQMSQQMKKERRERSLLMYQMMLQNELRQAEDLQEREIDDAQEKRR